MEMPLHVRISGGLLASAGFFRLSCPEKHHQAPHLLFAQERKPDWSPPGSARL